jgi:hypothetical protein
MVGSTAALIAGTRDSTITSAINSAVKRLRVFISVLPFVSKRFARPAEQLFFAAGPSDDPILYFCPVPHNTPPAKRGGETGGKTGGMAKFFGIAQKK